MASFGISDRRGSPKTSHTMEQEITRLRRQGMTLPNHPGRAAQSARDILTSVQDGSAFKAVRRRYERGDAVMPRRPTVEQARESNMRRTASDLSIAIDKQREPLQTLEQKGIPFNTADPEERAKIWSWARAFYTTHHLQPLCVDVYTRFPVQGVEIDVKDPALKSFYEDLFFDTLNYEEFLIDLGREYWTVGEMNALASFSETLGVWDSEEILNPLDVVVEKSPFLNEPTYKLKVPETIREILEKGEPKRDYEILIRDYPEFRQMMHSTEEDEGLNISSILLSRIVNKANAWDTRGTPHMMRCFRTLMTEEALNAAQDAVADRLYSPLILAKLGSPDLGDGEPWIPDHEELDNFKNDMQMALAADFRFMAYHFGLDIHNVFGREAMPRFDGDFDRAERKQLQVWGIGESLISGGSGQAAYASSALNREFVTQLMTGYQKSLQRHFRKRAEIVAEAQEHWDYKTSNGVRVPVYEEVLEVDEETGQEYVRKRPKLLIPTLSFKTMNLRDEAQERAFLGQLKSMGVPISDQSLMVNIDIEFDEELEKVKLEKVQKIVAEQEMNVATIHALKGANLPIPETLIPIAQQLDALENPQPAPTNQVPFPGMEQTGESGPAGPGAGPEQGEEGGPGPTPGPLSGGPTSPGSMPVAAGGGGGEDPSKMPPQGAPPTPDIMTELAPTPNIAPFDQGAPAGIDEGDVLLPRNQIRQRPEVSDEHRSRAPRAAFNDPSVHNLRLRLKTSSVEHAVSERPWQEYVRPSARERLRRAQAKLEES